MNFTAKCISVDFEKNTITFQLPDSFWTDKRISGGADVSEINCPNIRESGCEIEENSITDARMIGCIFGGQAIDKCI